MWIPMPRPIDGDVLLELYEFPPDYAEALSVPIPVVVQNILDMPTLDYAPVRHGEWESVTCEGYYIPNIFEKTKREFPVCSECHKQNSIDAWTKPFYYCPYCGARMDAKEDER